MCGICGCGETDQSEHHHAHDHHPDHHQHGHAHHHHEHAHGSAGSARLIQIEQDLLSKNNAFAAANRRYFTEHGIFTLNLVSSPGSGKTTLLARSAEHLKNQFPVAVIEGDQQTSLDADRIRAAGVPAVQINTGKGCHLDAHGIGHAVQDLALPDNSVLFIENVGNLVCPAAFDLGEAHKVVIISVTEGEDKPLKYPDMFAAADLMLINKTDLLPYVSFDVERCIEYARRVRPGLQALPVSASKGVGLDAWYNWIASERLYSKEKIAI